MNDKNLKALFKGLGLPDSILEDIEKTDFDAAKVVSSFNESQKTHYRDIIKNEITPEIEGEVQSKVEGKWLATLNNDLKKTFGITADKIKDLPVHEKLKLVKTTMEESYSKNPNVDEIRKLQEEKMEWQNKYADYESKFSSEVEKAKTEWRRKAVTKLTDTSLTKIFHDIPADKIVGGHAEVTLLGLKSYMNNKFDWDLDENENTIFFEKGTSKRATLKDASGKEYFATPMELMLTSLKETKGLKESNGGEGSGNQGRGGNGTGNGQQKSAHMLELEKAAAEATRN